MNPKKNSGTQLRNKPKHKTGNYQRYPKRQTCPKCGFQAPRVINDFPDMGAGYKCRCGQRFEVGNPEKFRVAGASRLKRPNWLQNRELSTKLHFRRHKLGHEPKKKIRKSLQELLEVG